MYKFFSDLSFELSAIITKKYSTSFSSAVALLEKEKREAIYGIYAFVRFADEIVDTFHQSDKEYLLNKFEEDLNYALSEQISMNTVLYAFALTVKKYRIPDHLIRSFLDSMKLDLYKSEYLSEHEIKAYIYGSADVVGLMCLCVFLDGNKSIYDKLKMNAMALGAAFQKVNFLRDLKNDIHELNRTYFPNVNKNNFDEKAKQSIIENIENDFTTALIGIKQLPGRSKLAVLIAYFYYSSLLKKLKNTPANKILETRIRINNFIKSILFLKSYFYFLLKLI